MELNFQRQETSGNFSTCINPLAMNMLTKHKKHLYNHPLYKDLVTIEHIRIFMEIHIFAVWDFMSLLKSLQRNLTTITVPWTPCTYSPELTRFINEIVIAEESDLDSNNKPNSHYVMYRDAMEEIGAKTSLFDRFLNNFSVNTLPEPIKNFISFTLDLATSAPPHQVAAAFFYGRENPIPLMFDRIVRTIEEHSISCPSLLYYLKRHIELDGNEHGPMAETCIRLLCDTPQKLQEAHTIAVRAIHLRIKLWDYVADQLKTVN